MNKFIKFVQENKKWFKGKFSETDDSLNKVEEILSIKIPEQIRWLLKEYGYWHATGISGLEESIKDTLDAREHLDLPNNFLVLWNHHDAGLIMIDTIKNKITSEYTVYNSGIESIPDDMENDITYLNYLEYVKEELKNQKLLIDECDTP